MSNVVDVFNGIVPCKFLSLGFKSQFITGTAIGSQIGDDLGAFPVSKHDLQTSEKTFLIKQMLHEQLIDQDVNVKADVVINHLPFELPEEVSESHTKDYIFFLG